MSDYLFAQPSTLSGMARVADLWAQLDEYNICHTGEEADARAVYCDWLAVGRAMLAAMKKYSEQTPEAAA